MLVECSSPKGSPYLCIYKEEEHLDLRHHWNAALADLVSFIQYHLFHHVNQIQYNRMYNNITPESYIRYYKREK